MGATVWGSAQKWEQPGFYLHIRKTSQWQQRRLGKAALCAGSAHVLEQTLIPSGEACGEDARVTSGEGARRRSRSLGRCSLPPPWKDSGPGRTQAHSVSHRQFCAACVVSALGEVGGQRINTRLFEVLVV